VAEQFFTLFSSIKFHEIPFNSFRDMPVTEEWTNRERVRRRTIMLGFENFKG